MTEEIKQETENNSKWSISPDFAKFLLTIAASFIGCLVALCLFTAAIRPPERPCPPAMHLRYDAPYYDGHREFKPDHPHKKHKIEAKKNDIKPPVKKEIKKADNK